MAFIRVNQNHLFLKKVPISALTCPLCQVADQLEMSFYQLQIETDNIHNTRKITASIKCNHCAQDVPTIRWSPELDGFYKAEKKNIKVTTSFKIGTKGKILLWIAAIFFGGVFLLFIVLYIYGHLKAK